MQLHEYYKHRKRAGLRRKLTISFFLAFFWAVAIWGFFWVPYFRVSNIETVGAASDADVKKTVLAYLGSVNRFFLPNNHYFLISPEEVRNILKDSGFGLASAEKAFPNSLVVRFAKSEPWLIFCLSAKAPPDCFYVDVKGVLSDRAPNFSENPIPQIEGADAPDVKLGDSIISYEDVSFLRTWFENLKKLAEEPSRIAMEKGNNLKIFLKEGWFIYLSRNSDPQKIFYDLKLLLDQKIKDTRSLLEYVDLRFENKAFYKLK